MDYQIAEEDQGMELSDSLHIWIFRGKIVLRSYWWILLITLSSSLLFQVYQEKKRDPVYASTGRMIVDGHFIILKREEGYNENYFNFYGTQLELMQSARVKEDAHKRVLALKPHLKKIPVTLKASRKEDTSIFVLTALGGHPEYTRAFLDACMESYMAFRNESRSRASGEAVVNIKQELARLEKDIDSIENAVVDFQREHSIDTMEKIGGAASSDLAKLKNQLAELQTEAHMLDNLTLDEHLTSSPTLSETGWSGERNILDTAGDYVKAKREYDRLLADEEEFSKYLKPKHPKMIAFRDELTRQSERLTILRRQSMEKLEQKRKVLNTRIENLVELISQKEKTSRDYGLRLAEFKQLNDRLERYKTRYEERREKMLNIERLTPLQPETIAILENAKKAYASKENVVEKLVLGGAGGLFAGLGILFIIGFMDNRLVSVEDIKRNFDKPVLGLIPTETKSSKGELEFLQPKDTRHVFAEACRTLRSSILFMENGDSRSRTFVVTSSVPEEGKSTIAGNLAIALGLASSRVLLIDADLRRGRLHKVFSNVPKPTGLSELIRDDIALEDVVQSREDLCFDFLPCGEYPERPGELFLNPKFDVLLEEMRKRYDYVIFDSAPILATDDTCCFANKVDSLLFTVRSSYTQVRQVKTSVDRLEMRGTKVFGFVLNYVDTKGADYYYYSKYNKYYTSAAASA